MNLISFSVYGPAPRYWHGALRNAVIAAETWPGWTCRFYCDRHNHITDALDKMPNVQMEYRQPSQPNIEMFWRFLPASDTGGVSLAGDEGVILFRDADSRLSKREFFAVHDWMQGDCGFHIIRDHPAHFAVPMRGGLWAVRSGVIADMANLIIGHCFRRILAPRHEDEAFLTEVIWPTVKTVRFHQQEDHFIHPANDTTAFIGQSFDEHDHPLN